MVVNLADVAYQHELSSKANDQDFVNSHFNELEMEYNKTHNVKISVVGILLLLKLSSKDKRNKYHVPCLQINPCLCLWNRRNSFSFLTFSCLT